MSFLRAVLIQCVHLSNLLSMSFNSRTLIKEKKFSSSCRRLGRFELRSTHECQLRGVIGVHADGSSILGRRTCDEFLHQQGAQLWVCAKSV
ncbi:hypothetical protein BDZ89DRAFT_626606 [Hymenopellis radicata]|nr:hypothetical protein BDZ89DRAFT_626606 [Hymenopellis radicata]